MYKVGRVRTFIESCLVTSSSVISRLLCLSFSSESFVAFETSLAVAVTLFPFSRNCRTNCSADGRFNTASVSSRLPPSEAPLAFINQKAVLISCSTALSSRLRSHHEDLSAVWHSQHQDMPADRRGSPPSQCHGLHPQQRLACLILTLCVTWMLLFSFWRSLAVVAQLSWKSDLKHVRFVTSFAAFRHTDIDRAVRICTITYSLSVDLQELPACTGHRQ